MKRRIAIQGIKGCNHHVAAINFFEGDEIETIDCSTFRQLAQEVCSDDSVLGIMAIENTIAGCILPNFNLLRENNLVILGEYKLRIAHALVALPGVKQEEIREVNSHPMALMQCQDYLDTMSDIKIVEKEDTAGSAAWIKENNLRTNAAICPKEAAAIYGLNVLANHIETNKHNYTRFLIIANRSIAPEEVQAIRTQYGNKALAKAQRTTPNKSSLVFTLPHTVGSLSTVLSIFSDHQLNLTLLQSLPIVGKEWEYRFYMNLVYSDYERYKQAMNALLPLTSEFKLLGEFIEGYTDSNENDQQTK